MSTDWTWPEGKTFGELTPDEKRLAAQRAGAQLEAELTANVDAISRVMSDPDDLGVETRPQRLARAERDGEVFERCRFGDRVSTCYHNPRCAHEVPGFGRFVPGPGPCHICSGEADGECAICDKPVCDEDAAHKDGDRFCRTCAPHPGGA